MKPILFPPTATSFVSNGLGALSDCTSAVVSEVRNGEFDLTLTVPVDGAHFSEIEDRSLILARPNPYFPPQPFRVCRQTKPINGLVQFFAHHWSYDLDGVPVAPISATTAAQAVEQLRSRALVSTPFTFSTDIDMTAPMWKTTPAVIRALLGGSENSLLDVYGGELEFDGSAVKLLQARGRNRGVKFKYGRNLVDLTQERNLEAVYTGVLPFWHDDAQGLVQGSIRSAPGRFDFQRIYPLDLSDAFDGKPTAEQLEEKADVYIADNKISTPRVSMTVSVVPPGSLGIASLDEVHPWDTVEVEFERLGVSAEAQVVSYSYDVLAERYLSLELGERRGSIADTIVGLETETGKAPTTTAMQRAIKNATDLITGVTGGSVVWGFDSRGVPIELYFLDTDSVTTAKDVLRINRNGIGFSTSGVAGPFDTAWTIDGSFYAKYIVAGTIVADKLANEAVTEPKIAPAAVTAPKIGGGAVTGPKIGAGAVTGPKIGAGAVGEGKIANGAVTSPTIKGGAVTYEKTDFQGTLDQVGINKSDIAAINALLVGSLTVYNLYVNNNLYINNRLIQMSGGFLRY